MALHERALQTSAVAPLLDKKISFHIVASVVTDPKLGEPKQMQGYVKPATTTAIVSVISMKVHNVTRNVHFPMRLTTCLLYTSPSPRD